MKIRIINLLLFLTLIWIYYTRLYATCALESTEPNTNINSLISDLSSSRACKRSKAAFDLQKIGREGKSAVPKLVELLKDSDPSVRWRSAGALGHIRYFNDEIKNALYESMNDENEIVRTNTIFALGSVQFSHYENSVSSPLNENHKYKESDKSFEIFLKGLSDKSPIVITKTLAYLDVSQFRENGQKYLRVLEDKLIDLRNNESLKSQISADNYNLIQRRITEIKIDKNTNTESVLETTLNNLTKEENTKNIEPEAAEENSPTNEDLAELNNRCTTNNISGNNHELCLKVRTIAEIRLTREERKTLFRNNCMEKNHIFSCITFLLDYDDKDPYYHNLVKDHVLSLTKKSCSDGNSKDCANWAILKCKEGSYIQGNAGLAFLCVEDSKYCDYFQYCSEKTYPFAGFFFTYYYAK